MASHGVNTGNQAWIRRHSLLIAVDTTLILGIHLKNRAIRDGVAVVPELDLSGKSTFF